jgi:hypothetical protein
VNLGTRIDPAKQARIAAEQKRQRERRVLASMVSGTCACGKPKEKGDAFCQSCYRCLQGKPGLFSGKRGLKGQFMGLERKPGEGLEEAYVAALEELNRIGRVRDEAIIH